ncbi:peroxide stress protein YaaA [Falsihalocynthiibacter sp. S25ZX9]|uniref:peroxide stress protein YaaA n=1 Tax=Falsihalocynthiibacter sp. S25ZX9 TaxID=3240870 RepID=UPI00351091D4
MLTVISPAKRLNFDPIDGPVSFPKFQEDATSLAATASRLSVKKLQELMSISSDLAKLNAQRFRDFESESTLENAKQAAYAFAGDTYLGLEASSLDADEMDFARGHLRILSGLYGVLAPHDLIQPYRLEMGSRLKTRQGKTLYAYWGNRIAKALNDAAQASGSDILVNCASKEYFTAVDLSVLTLKIVTPQFLEDRPGGPKIISFSAKKARGAMARFVIQNRIEDPQGLRDFESGGFLFAPERSTPEQPVFIKPMA